MMKTPAGDNAYHCGLQNCTLAGGPRVTDARMEFIACPHCGVLRSPEEQLVRDRVDPDIAGPLSLTMRVLFSMRMLWLRRAVPALKRKTVRILDVGCGDGQFLAYLTGRGFTALAGIEPDEKRARHARRHHVAVFAGLEEARAAGKIGSQSDLIFVWHVLEHVREPAPFLKLYAELLSQGGQMLISVPNQDALQTRLFGELAAYPDYGRHIWFHTADFCNWIAEALPAMRVSLLRNLNFEYEIFAWVESLASAVTRQRNIVQRALKKGEGPASHRLAVAALAIALLPLATLLSPVSLILGKGSTLTFRVEC